MNGSPGTWIPCAKPSLRACRRHFCGLPPFRAPPQGLRLQSKCEVIASFRLSRRDRGRSGQVLPVRVAQRFEPCFAERGSERRNVSLPKLINDDRKSVLSFERRSSRYKELCGIVGYTHKSWTPPPRRIREATATLIHRGPDQQGVFQSSLFSMGAARLKIIDLDSGNQPILSEDGDFGIAFNGEIYNS